MAMANPAPESARHPDPKYWKTASDHDLLRLCAVGNPEAFDAIVQRYKNPILNYIYRMLHDYDRALELTQETFIRVYKNAPRYKFMSTFSSWIYKIATNLTLNEIRRRKYVKFNSLVPPKNIDPDEEVLEMDLEDTKSPLPDQLLEKDETVMMVRKAIDSLPPKYRSPLILRDVDGMSYEDISKSIRLPLGTVKSRINRGRLLIKKKLEKFFRF